MDNSMYSLKYRPFDLNGMIGQKGIIREFKNRSIKDNYPQVMIFEGLSGSGKTTLAFIIAGLINCTNPIIIDSDDIPYKKPCGECASCKDIQGEIFARDISFLDASSMGKDDVLSIEDVINYSPIHDENKVIIIDEAQELSKAGKGAALKLLEKKRKNVYFILCTMSINILDQELKKALKSRCQLYKFRNVLSQDIASYLYDILKKEGISETVPDIFITEGIFTISNSVNGNVREAIQYLERCIIGGYYSKEEILKEFGFVTEEKAIELIMKILNRDTLFFLEIKKIGIKEFYFYSWKIILEVNLFIITGKAEKKWQENTYKQFIKKPGIYNLLKIYNDIHKDMGIYFKDNIYLSKILEFFKSFESTPKITSRRPVRK